MKPRIFISAVSSEFGTSRQLVANVLSRLGYDPVWQDIFGTESGDLRQVLREKIDDCDGLIQLVGRGYGAEPPTVDAEFGRVSYTQFEFLYARLRGKKTWLIFADEGCTRDRPLGELDLPRDEGEPVSGTALAAGHSPENVDPDSPVASAKPLKASAIQAERRALQEQWRQRWQKDSHLFHGVASDTDLELRVERLRDEFAELRREFRWWQQSVTRNLTIVAALVLVSVGVGMYVARQQQQLPERVTEKTAEQVQQAQEKTADQIAAAQKQTEEHVDRSLEKVVQVLANPAVLADRIRKEIHATAESKIKTLPDEKGRGRLVAEIEKERDLALGRVDDLIKLIQEGLKEGASPVFQRAAEILQKEGTDAAIEYLESSRPKTLETARRHAEQAKTAQARADAEKELRNKSLQALVLEAELLETKLQWQPALELREQVAELAPDWFEARNRLGVLHLKLARFRVAEQHLRATVKLAANPSEEAAALNNLGQLLQATNRLAEAESLIRRALDIDEQTYGAKHPQVATALNNLAQLLKATNRLMEAEPLMRRALDINEQFYGAVHPDVATCLNNLAQLLEATNRLMEAEPLMRRAMDVYEQSFGAEHPQVATALNNLAQLLKATNRLVEAEPLMRRALAIDEQSYGPEHPGIAIGLNNLAQLLQATNRLAEAESLMRRAMAIDEHSYGTEHPDVAINLNNLAQLLQATNRLAEAEPLIRRALAIFEKSFGSEHPNVATTLNNLAQLLWATNRLAEAEPLMRRALAIFEKSLGSEHPNVATILNNLAQLLRATNRLAEAESLMRRAMGIDEKSYGAEHPVVAIELNNLAQLLQAGNRLEEAEPLMRRHVTIFHLFGLKTGHRHPHMQAALVNYRGLLQTMELPPGETDQRIQAALQTSSPLKAIGPEVERLLGPAKSVADVFAALDRQYKADDKLPIYFLRPDQPIAPHLDQLLGRSKLDVPLNEPIVPHLEKLLGPAKTTQEVFETLDRQYREQNKSAIWFLPLSQPIAPHLDELLGPLK